jgi:hypothetical protein
MIIKKLTKSGKNKVIRLEKALLDAAGLDEHTMFQIVINPNGGLLIQSISTTHEQLIKSSFQNVVRKNHPLLKRMADR